MDQMFPSMVNVTSRKGRVSRNPTQEEMAEQKEVTSRKGRVSRNMLFPTILLYSFCHVP